MPGPNRYAGLTSRVGALKRILSIKGLSFGRRKASDDSVFYDQYPGQWSTETAPREALVANVDWSVSPNPGLLAGGFDYYPRAEEDWSGQQQEQRSYARDAQGQPVPRFCLTDSWEDLPGTLAGMKAFSTALNTGIVLAPSSSASSAGSAQLDGAPEQNDEVRHTENGNASSAECSKRTSAGSSAVSFEFSLCTSGRTSSSSLPSELPTDHQCQLASAPNSTSISVSYFEPFLPSEGVDKGKTPIWTVEEEHCAALDGCPVATSPATVIRDVFLPDTQYSFGARALTAREEKRTEKHPAQQLDRDAGSGMSLADYAYSYIYQDEREDDAAIPRVLRVVNVS